MTGGKHAELIWHRRSGKDDISLHATAIKAMERPATYWHMLPKKNQVRTAIWEAVNPHTGMRRIDEAFPREIRASTREHEMLIKFKNGSTWQALGSDNYEGAIGSPPAGIVYSEWPQAKPQARAYLRPILVENDGWQLFIGTPRGKNHGYKTFRAAEKNVNAFAQKLTADQTSVFTKEQLEQEKQALIDEWGIDMGEALFEQEYYCSFEAAILGAFYTKEARELEKAGRLTDVEHDPDHEVYVACDIGRTDDTAIWWFQVINGEVRLLESISESGKDPDWFCSQLLGKEVHINIVQGEIVVDYGKDIPELAHRKAYRYGKVGLPHDARSKTYAAKGKSPLEQTVKALGNMVGIVPNLGKLDGIKATRQMLRRTWIDRDGCDDGWEAVKQYRREWSQDKQCFLDNDVHDWTSHYADGLRYVGVMWQEKVQPKEQEPVKTLNNMTMNDLWRTQKSRQSSRI